VLIIGAKVTLFKSTKNYIILRNENDLHLYKDIDKVLSRFNFKEVAMKRLSIFAVLLAVITASASMAQAEGVQRPVLVIKDGRFIPDTLEVAAGQKISLEIRNEGKGAEEFESSDLNREKLIPAGGQVTIAIGPLKPGKYRFFGEFNPTTAQGVIIAR
jgi:hypothetical protein